MGAGMDAVKFKFAEPVAGLLFLAISGMASAADATCEGYATLLYADERNALFMCHGSYTEVDRKSFGKWQACDDAVILIRDKRSGRTSQSSDCLSESGKQFRVDGSVFMLRHFLMTYPEFEPQPLVIEYLDMKSGRRTYELERRFPVCTREDIDDAAKQIDSATTRPFDGKAYFATVYGSFHRLRDCAASAPRLVISILNKYQTSGQFDGETAETLTSVIDEVSLINSAVNMR